jgi:hypothetical protein
MGLFKYVWSVAVLLAFFIAPVLATTSAETAGDSFFTRVGCSLGEAYAKIPHRRTPFNARRSPMDEVTKRDVSRLLSIADRGVVLRVRLTEELARGGDGSELIELYEPLLLELKTVGSPKINEVSSLLESVLMDHRQFFSDWAAGAHGGGLSHPIVTRSSSRLHRAYAILLGISPDEESANKQAFFDSLCALDFI